MAKKVSEKLERLLTNLCMLPSTGINVPMVEVLRSFFRGELDLYDAVTGRRLLPSDYVEECRGLCANGVSVFPVADGAIG